MKVMRRLTTLGDPLFWQVQAVVYTVLFVAVLFAVVVRATTERRKDILFVGPAPRCIGDVVECAQSLHFSGDWAGTRLCRAGKCAKFEDIVFTEVWDAKRH